MSLRLYDGHNHLQDARLAPYRATFPPLLDQIGVVRMVVHGTRENDWPDVQALAREQARVWPAYGLHPWFVPQRSDRWQAALEGYLESAPAPVAVGEIGLDRWIAGHDLNEQREVFVWQWRLAVARGLPVTVHCLRAWGALLDILQAEPRPSRGFLLHSYGGPIEMIQPLARLGAYFSVSGHLAQPRKARQREVIRSIPRERLLIETDAPDMPLPEEWTDFALPPDAEGRPLNHPANLGAVYRFVAECLGAPIESLAAQVEENFHRLFGRAAP